VVERRCCQKLVNCHGSVFGGHRDGIVQVCIGFGLVSCTLVLTGGWPTQIV